MEGLDCPCRALARSIRSAKRDACRTWGGGGYVAQAAGIGKTSPCFKSAFRVQSSSPAASRFITVGFILVFSPGGSRFPGSAPGTFTVFYPVGGSPHRACPHTGKRLKDSPMTPPQEPPLRDNTGNLRKDEQSAKKDRLAAALRENLRRRKAQRAGRANSVAPDAESVHPHDRGQAPVDVAEDSDRN